MGHPWVNSALRRLRGRSVKGRFYRTVSDAWRKQVASPLGSSKVDGRYHTAILAPTARPGLQGANLVVFLEVLTDPGASVRLLPPRGRGRRRSQ